MMASVTVLGGCYVMPLEFYPLGHPQAGTTIPAHVAAAPGPTSFSARLYPANDAASVYGVLSATVTNNLNGRGHFTASIQGESFSGEATRVAGSSRDGLASGVGNRGGYISCRYAMNSPTLGMGDCRLSTGAKFTMHVGR